MWSLDRRIAASAVVVAALALAIPLAVADGPAPAHPGDDPLALATELANLANRGAHGSWLVTFSFTRTNASGTKLHSNLVSAQRGSMSVDAGLGSLVVTVAGGRTYSCATVVDQPKCISSREPVGTARPGDVYGGAVVSGRYDISRVESPPIAGVDARCFALRLRTGVVIAGLGYASTQCYSVAGVPLRSRITRPGGTDERVALTVRTPVGRDDLLPLLMPDGLERLAPSS